jgi:DNA-binding transcriptional MerR regulator
MNGGQKMNQMHYTISEAAKELHVEPHVLRYWEEEMRLKVPRNKMGHRQYSETELTLFRQITKWKEEGLSLKDIHVKCIEAGIAPAAAELSSGAEHGQVIPYPQESPATDAENKMLQFKQILGRIVADAIHENKDELTSDIASGVSEQVNKELDFLFREKEEADETRFRQLDETIRSFQKARQEAAVAEMNGSKKKGRRRFRKKR